MHIRTFIGVRSESWLWESERRRSEVRDLRCLGSGRDDRLLPSADRVCGGERGISSNSGGVPLSEGNEVS